MPSAAYVGRVIELTRLQPSKSAQHADTAHDLKADMLVARAETIYHSSSQQYDLARLNSVTPDVATVEYEDLRADMMSRFMEIHDAIPPEWLAEQQLTQHVMLATGRYQ